MTGRCHARLHVAGVLLLSLRLQMCQNRTEAEGTKVGRCHAQPIQKRAFTYLMPPRSRLACVRQNRTGFRCWTGNAHGRPACLQVCRLPLHRFCVCLVFAAVLLVCHGMSLI